MGLYETEEKFVALFGSEALDAYAEAELEYYDNDVSKPPFEFIDKENDGPLRTVFHCVYTAPDGKNWEIISESGIDNGNVMLELSESPLKIEIEQRRKYFVPIRERTTITPFQLAAYRHWRTSGLLPDKERDMNYDFHFDPCNLTYDYYRDWAKERGLRIGGEDSLKEYLTETEVSNV